MFDNDVVKVSESDLESVSVRLAEEDIVEESVLVLDADMLLLPFTSQCEFVAVRPMDFVCDNDRDAVVLLVALM